MAQPAAVLEALGESAFDRAWQAGATSGLQAAVEFACGQDLKPDA